MLDSLRHALIRILSCALGMLIMWLIGLEVAQVILRYFLATGVTWGRDVSTLTLFSIAWLGAPVLWLQRRHLAVDLLPVRLWRAPFWDAALDLAVVLAALGLLGVTWQAMDAFVFIDLPALGTSAAIKFWPMVLGSMLLALAGVLNLLTMRERR